MIKLTFVVTLLSFLLCGSIAISEEKSSEEDITNKLYNAITCECSKEWPNDYSMQEYCINMQKESLHKFFIYWGMFPENSVAHEIMLRASREWQIYSDCSDPLYNFNWRMVIYEVEKQFEAYGRLNEK